MTTEDRKQKVFQLDVGGTLYKVSRDTLDRCEGSMLASLVSDKWKEGNTNEEPIFIDRNGRLFEYVLDYLRTNKVCLPLSVSRSAVMEELEYYGFDEISTVSEQYGLDHLVELVQDIKQKTKEVAAIKESFDLAKQFAEYTERIGKCMRCKVELGFDEELLRECLRSRGLEVEKFERTADSMFVTITPIAE